MISSKSFIVSKALLSGIALTDAAKMQKPTPVKPCMKVIDDEIDDITKDWDKNELAKLENEGDSLLVVEETTKKVRFFGKTHKIRKEKRWRWTKEGDQSDVQFLGEVMENKQRGWWGKNKNEKSLKRKLMYFPYLDCQWSKDSKYTRSPFTQLLCKRPFDDNRGRWNAVEWQVPDSKMFDVYMAQYPLAGLGLSGNEHTELFFVRRDRGEDGQQDWYSVTFAGGDMSDAEKIIADYIRDGLKAESAWKKVQETQELMPGLVQFVNQKQKQVFDEWSKANKKGETCQKQDFIKLYEQVTMSEEEKKKKEGFTLVDMKSVIRDGWSNLNVGTCADDFVPQQVTKVGIISAEHIRDAFRGMHRRGYPGLDDTKVDLGVGKGAPSRKVEYFMVPFLRNCCCRWCCCCDAKCLELGCYCTTCHKSRGANCSTFSFELLDELVKASPDEEGLNPVVVKAAQKKIRFKFLGGMKWCSCERSELALFAVVFAAGVMLVNVYWIVQGL